MTQTIELPLPSPRTDENKLVSSVCFAHFVSHYYITLLAPLFIFVRKDFAVSYTELARRIGAPKSVRAVAQACGANKLAVAIPCHRVVRNDGTPSGYRWGVARKRTLLERESKE